MASVVGVEIIARDDSGHFDTMCSESSTGRVSPMPAFDRLTFWTRSNDRVFLAASSSWICRVLTDVQCYPIDRTRHGGVLPLCSLSGSDGYTRKSRTLDNILLVHISAEDRSRALQSLVFKHAVLNSSHCSRLLDVQLSIAHHRSNNSLYLRCRRWLAHLLRRLRRSQKCRGQHVDGDGPEELEHRAQPCQL
jgi:hypothetical protein